MTTNLRSLIPATAIAMVASCGREPVDRFRELEIVDDVVTHDERARNDRNGAWSFRHLALALGADEAEATETARDAFVALGADTSREIVCPWLKETPANQCDADCAHCAARDVDLVRAPLRLIAISNRIDERSEHESPGELRFVFAVTQGPGDDPRSPPRAMTVIIELALPPTRSQREWAGAWHALGGLDDAAYLRSLEGLTNAVVTNATLAQVRTNAAAGEPDPGMKEFVIDAHGRFRLRPLSETSLEGAKSCRGCHGGRERTIDDGFHISPFREGRAKLSPFVHDPAAFTDDDLARRETFMRSLL